MGTPAPPDLTASRVPVAFYGRTSTWVLQNPAASLGRQLRGVREKLPPGWFIAAWYWDIESGGLDLESRGHGTGYEAAEVDMPRDGGIAALLAEAASPMCRFAAVICEDIERSARDTFSALKLEKELAAAGVPLFATDEPIDITGGNATTVLVRRVKQGVAEWYRLQIKEKVWKGLREHSLAGWNIGPAPYGYTADRQPHPVAYKAAEGRTKTRLALDPARAPAVAAIYTWRTRDRLGVASITTRLNSDLDAYPPPDPSGGWQVSAVRGILANPKYTGHMVFGRRRVSGGKTRKLPPSEWLWTPEPTHPAIITRGLWDAAQEIGGKHSTARDDLGRSTHPAARRTYSLRSRVRCRECRHRMTGITRYTTGREDSNAYYICGNKTAAAKYPDHPKTVAVREDRLLHVIAGFFTHRVFGPDRKTLLLETLTATPADQQALRDKMTAKLRKRLHQIDTAENAHAREIEALAGDNPNSRGVIALRKRILARFDELEEEREHINTQLETLTTTADDSPGDPGLLDLLPTLGDILSGAPQDLQAKLFQAFDLQCLYNRPDDQVSIRVTLTPHTPIALAELITDSETPQTHISVTENPGPSVLARHTID